ncbi:tandem-95 repeat protein [Halomonas denitrificans]|nr:tandem-95 repeat protein [Halomonas denitrificans]
MRDSTLARGAFAALTVAFVAGLALFSAPLAAQAPDPVYDVLVDLDRNASTGCSATYTGSAPEPGFERRLRATLDVDTQTIVSVDLQSCDGVAFQTVMALGGAYPAGLNVGVGGTDVIELAVTRDALGAGSQALIRLAFAADNFTGSDLLTTIDGSGAGPGIFLGLPISVPTLSILGLLVLAVLVTAIAWRAHRRAGQLGAVGLVLLVATVAWAMNFSADGDVSDWAGRTPSASDPAGDATDGSAVIDLREAFAAFEDGGLFFRIDVTDIENQPPVVVDDAYATDEDTPLSVAAPGVLANDSDPDGDPITAVLQTGPGNAQAFTLNADGSFDYTPAADFNGSDSFTYVANDGQADSSVATVAITVNAVNDPPVAQDDSATTLEDNPVPVDVLANDSDIDGSLDPASVAITTPPANGGTTVDPGTGVVTYTKTGDFNGTDSFVYEVCDDGTPLPAECASATVTIDVQAVNDAPSFTPGPDPTVLEDAGAQTVAAWATAISAGPPDEAGQVLTFNVTGNDNPGLFSAGPAIDAGSGDLTFTPAADANGSATITITLSDDGGTANGGVDTSPPAIFTITVDPVNDAPTFTPGGDVSVLEDSGAYSQPWASAISPGPADESGQVVSFPITGNTDPALFAAGPSIAADGTLSFTPAADANGSATITVVAMDDGGTANGGVDTSAPASFVIDLTAVNDAPSFTAGPDVSSDEDAGPQTDAGWATAIDPGAPDEGGQVLTFNVVGNDNPTLFAAGPSIDPGSGDLTYTAAPNANGVANITITLSDDGGTANGGVDTSPPATFSITVNPINDPPTVTAPGPFDVLGNVRIQVTDGADDLLANASDAADGPGALPLFIGGTVPATTVQGGDLSINTADGTFSYNPPAGFTGADSFDYQVCDNGTPGSACSAAVTVDLTVTDRIWFVDPAAPAGGDGRLATPFNDIDLLDAVNDGVGTNPGPGDALFVDSGAQTGSLTLLAGQRLFGAAASAPLATMAGVTVPPYSDPLPASPAAAPELANPGGTVLTLGSDNLLRGVHIGDSITDIVGNGFGTLTVSETQLLGTGTALDLNNGTVIDGAGSGGFTTVTSTSASTNLRLFAIDGSPTLGTGSLGGATGSAVIIDGGTATLSYAGSITATTGIAPAVSIRNRAGGSVELSGSITSTTGGIELDSNGPSSVTLSGTLDIDTSATPGIAGLVATNGGTLNVTGPGNRISTAGARAIDVANVTLGAAGASFESVSASGGDHGIRLLGTGAGAFSINGAGGACTLGTAVCSGGRIENTTSHGLLLQNAANVTLRNLRVDATGDANDENGIEIVDPSGTWLIDSSAISDAADDAIELGFTGAGTLASLTVTNSELDGIGDFPGGVYAMGAGNGFAGAALDLDIANGGTLGTLTLNGLTLTDFDGRGISIDVGTSATSGTLSGGSVDNISMNGIGTLGFVFNGDGTGVGVLDFADSSIANVDNSSALVSQSNGNASITLGAARTTASVVNESFFGVSCKRLVNDGNVVADTPQLSVTLDSHGCTDGGDAEPLFATGRGSQGRFDLQSTNNTLLAAPGTFIHGSYIQAGNGTAGEADTVCLDKSGNDSDGADGEPGIRLVQFGGTTYHLEGFAGTGTSAVSVESFIDTQNPLSTPGSDVDDFTGVVNFSTPAAPCNTPAVP